MKRFLPIIFILMITIPLFAQHPASVRQYVGWMDAAKLTASDFQGMQLPKIGGTWFWVDPANGTDSSTLDGKCHDNAFASLTYGYNACTSGAGDGIILVSGAVSGSSNSSTMTTRIAWAKYGITVIGLAAPNAYFGRARVTHTSAADSLVTLIYLTGQNNTFINIDFYNSPENDGDPVSATAKVSAVQLSGPRNAFINCHFNCSPQSANAYKSDLEIRVSGDETVFNNCFFGSSSYDAGDNAACWIHLSGATAQNFFTDCTFLQQVSAGTAFGGFETSGAATLNGIDIFKRCVFAVWRANTHANICASWFIGTKPNTGNIGMLDCLTVGFTKIDAEADNDVVWSNQPAAAAGGGIGVATY